MVEEEEVSDGSPLAFLEKSHCISIILALSRNGILNRNQLYDELGQTINIVIKRIDLLIENEVIYEFKVPVKPFAKYIVLTEKGHKIAEHLKVIEEVVKVPGTGAIRRINLPYKEVFNLVVPDENADHFREFVRNNKKEASGIKCSRCDSITYLARDNKKYYWICVHCGNKEKADQDDILTVAVAEHY